MQIIRKKIKLDQLRGIITIPDSFKYKNVEILILPLEDEEEHGGSFDPEYFFAKSNISGIEAHVRKLREEWDRF